MSDIPMRVAKPDLSVEAQINAAGVGLINTFVADLFAFIDKGRECENPAIADGVFAVALDRAHFIDYGEQIIAVNEKVPQIALRDFFAVTLWEEYGIDYAIKH